MIKFPTRPRVHIENKKVLRERKTHTAQRVASTCCAAVWQGVPSLARGGYLPKVGICLPPPIGWTVGIPPPQMLTHVKTVPSRRTTYAGGKNTGKWLALNRDSDAIGYCSHFIGNVTLV